jgi:beta-N-acetylhexosaminidase
VLTELRRVPSGFAAFLVVGAAVVTMIVLAAVDSSVGRTQTQWTRAVATPSARPVINLGAAKYPKAAPATRAQPAPAQAAPAPQAQPRIPMRRLVGAKLIARMSGTAPSASLLGRARRGEIGGVILFGDNIGTRSQLRSLTRRLTQAARAGGAAGFIIAIDQEGGPVKRIPGAPPTQAPTQIATAGSSQQQGAATGSYLAALGVNVDLAPVLDVAAPGSFIASRAFAHTPARVAELGGAFADGLQLGGVAATAKHFPGLGHATVDTDRRPSVVGVSRAALDADLAPFARAIASGVPMVMMSNASYPAYGPGPAVLSPAVVQTQLRRRLGFAGVIVSDDLEAGAIRAVMSPSSAAVAASRVGVDMMLVARSPDSSFSVYRSLVAAARSGQLSRASLEQSYQRIQQVQSMYSR